MKNLSPLQKMLPVYCIVLTVFLLIGISGNHAITVLTESAPISNRSCVVIDAGHGGVDGGATSCTGILESNINLQIALKLDPLMHLLGIKTLMIRKTDISVYTEGCTTITAKKVSDLNNRVNTINNTQNGLVISIHQNTFSDSRYNGAQVFYAPTQGSELLAKKTQTAFVQSLNPGSNRQAKKANSVYLMQKIQCTGILVECGFLSNTQEEALLRSDAYQKKLCCVLASVCSSYLCSEQQLT